MTGRSVGKPHNPSIIIPCRLIHSCNKYLSRAYSVSSTDLGKAGKEEEVETENDCDPLLSSKLLQDFTFQGKGLIHNKYNKLLRCDYVYLSVYGI